MDQGRVRKFLVKLHWLVNAFFSFFFFWRNEKQSELTNYIEMNVTERKRKRKLGQKRSDCKYTPGQRNGTL